ncbi:MAG TPA: alginate lyase family protein [Blastocatellia bacterium]|nr:alginate lyase family protein [Blastocatellia bacterium]
MKLSLLLHTLPHLRWEQVFYRLLRTAQFRAYRALPRLAARWQMTEGRAPEPAAGAVETIREVFESSFAHLNTPLEWHDEKLSSLVAGKFTHLNRTLTIPAPDWNERYEGHLWNYQFHYFGFAVPCARVLVGRGDERAWRRCRELIESWIDGARIGASDGWDAYPVSLRVVNWIYAYALVADREADRKFLGKWRASIYQQLDFLSSHLELHLLANHLLENAKTLVIGGLFFAEDPKGGQWLERGERLLWREFAEQVLEDGGHYERAPMYHALALAAFLECFALLDAHRAKRSIAWGNISPGEIRKKLRAMARFLEAMSYPDGTLALFNDSANTEEARALPLLEAAARVVGSDPEAHSPVFPKTGYYCWFSPDGGERIIVDAGPPAVDYNAAHAHCDLLSYELWLDGRPFIVDSGVHGYGGDRFREYCRSTRAHNTVVFDGREQSEVWGTFRMGRRAEPGAVGVRSDEQTWEFRGSYTPYHDRGTFCERSIRRTDRGQWIFEDLMDELMPYTSCAASFIHLHPDVRARKISDDSLAVECRAGALTVVIEPFGAKRVRIIEGEDEPIQGWYFPEFGIAKPSQTICFEYLIKEEESFGYKISRPAGG